MQHCTYICVGIKGINLAVHVVKSVVMLSWVDKLSPSSFLSMKHAQT